MTFVCECPAGYALEEDNHTCEKSKYFIFVCESPSLLQTQFTNSLHNRSNLAVSTSITTSGHITHVVPQKHRTNMWKHKEDAKALCWMCYIIWSCYEKIVHFFLFYSYLVHPCNYPEGENGGCNQKCSTATEEAQCSCNEGFYMTSDGKTCKESKQLWFRYYPDHKRGGGLLIWLSLIFFILERLVKSVSLCFVRLHRKLWGGLILCSYDLMFLFSHKFYSHL